MKILIYPGYKKPSRYTNTFDKLGYTYTDNLTDDYDIVFFNDWVDCRGPLYLTQVPIVNQKLLNITKTYIDEVFESIFRYSIMPTENYTGLLLKKKNKQSSGRKAKIVRKAKKHRILHKYDPDRILYQKYIDTWDGEAYLDHRVFIYGQAKFVVNKRKYNLEIRRADADEYRLKSLGEVFDLDEIAKINMFCNKAGLDVGEIDIIRDKDHRIYILDINDYPTGKRALIDSPDLQGGTILDHCAYYMEEYLNKIKLSCI